MRVLQGCLFCSLHIRDDLYNPFVGGRTEKLTGPLLADTYVTLLKGRNAWYGQRIAKGEIRPDMGDSIQGKE